jgi:hypothetical protein
VYCPKVIHSSNPYCQGHFPVFEIYSAVQPTVKNNIKPENVTPARINPEAIILATIDITKTATPINSNNIQKLDIFSALF